MAEAIRLTFQKRSTEIPLKVNAFEKPFVDAKQTQWLTFRKRIQQNSLPVSFGDVVTVIETFPTPVIAQSLHQSSEALVWPASGPWMRKE